MLLPLYVSEKRRKREGGSIICVYGDEDGCSDTIRTHLKALKEVVELDQGNPTAEFESSPDPNKTQSRADSELELRKAIYEFSYPKFRRRFLKRAPMILKEYDTKE